MSSNQSPDTLTRDRIIRIDRSSCIARPELHSGQGVPFR
jgi:hypothetical protein